jgi:hypothetical protein
MAIALDLVKEKRVEGKDLHTFDTIFNFKKKRFSESKMCSELVVTGRFAAENIKRAEMMQQWTRVLAMQWPTC